jgi:hypothetical protein
METVRDESCGREVPLRILVLDTSPSCHFTVLTADGRGDLIQMVDITEATLSELERNQPDDWDIVITHVHDSSREVKALLPAASASSPREGGVPQNEFYRRRASRLRRKSIRGWRGIVRRMFHRERLTPFEREEQHATHTIILAEMQRHIGVALSAIEMGDFDTIGEIACRLRDDATGYDFARLSGLGSALYDTVPTRDIRTARSIAQKLMTYMGKTIGYYMA